MCIVSYSRWISISYLCFTTTDESCYSLWHKLIVFLFSFFWYVLGLGIRELLYFRVIGPEEIGYIFSAAPAKDFAGDFVSITLSSSVFHLIIISTHKSTFWLHPLLSFGPQTSSYDKTFLVPADPADACSDLKPLSRAKWSLWKGCMHI